jgi:hypothetical protein
MKNLYCYRAGKCASWTLSCGGLCFVTSCPLCYSFRLTTGASFSSVEHSRGQHVRLDVKDIDQFSLFPGQVNKSKYCATCIIYWIKLTQSWMQVVGIDGHNPSGHCFIASKLIDSIPFSVDAQLPSAKKQAIGNESPQNSNTDAPSRVLSSVSFWCIFGRRKGVVANIPV